MQTTAIPKNHMDIPWHEYSGHGNCPITEADLTEKASIVGRVGLMLLSCGTGIACPQFHEYDFTKSRNYMFDRYRSDVD